MAKKRKMKLKFKVRNPLRLVASCIILILLIILITIGIRAIFNSDPMKKTIEEAEGVKDVIILYEKSDIGSSYSRIEASVESGTVNAGDEISFEPIYVYKTEDSNPMEFIAEDELDIKVSNDDLAQVSENSVIVASEADSGGATEFTVTVKYGKLSAEFTYEVIYPENE